MSILRTSGSSSNVYSSYLQLLRKSATAETAFAAGSAGDAFRQTDDSTTSPGTLAARARTASFVKQLDGAIHYAMSGVSSDQSNDRKAVTSAIEQAFQDILRNHGIDPRQISHTGRRPHHYDGARRHSGGSTAAVDLSSQSDSLALSGSSDQFGASGGSRVSARDVSPASRTNHPHPGLFSPLSQLSVALQPFRSDLFLALLSSEALLRSQSEALWHSVNGTLKQEQVFQSVQTDVHVNVLI